MLEHPEQPASSNTWWNFQWKHAIRSQWLHTLYTITNVWWISCTTLILVWQVKHSVIAAAIQCQVDEYNSVRSHHLLRHIVSNHKLNMQTPKVALAATSLARWLFDYAIGVKSVKVLWLSTGSCGMLGCNYYRASYLAHTAVRNLQLQYVCLAKSGCSVLKVGLHNKQAHYNYNW